MPDTDKREVTELQFFNIMSNALYVYGTQPPHTKVSITEVADYIKSLADLALHIG